MAASFQTVSVTAFEELYRKQGTAKKKADLIYSIIVTRNLPVIKFLLETPSYRVTAADVLVHGIHNQIEELIDFALANGAIIEDGDLRQAVKDSPDVVVHLYEKSVDRVKAANTILLGAVELAFEILKDARDNDQIEEADSQELAQAVRYLTFALDHGASPDGEDDSYRPLVDAVDMNYLPVVKLLLDRGANPSIMDDMSRTPLVTSFNHINAELAQLLLERGAQVDPDIIEACIFEMTESDGYHNAVEDGLQEQEGYLEDMMLSFQRLIEHIRTLPNAEEILDNGWRYVETWNLPNPAWKQPFMELFGDRVHLLERDRLSGADRRAAFLAGEAAREQQRQKAAAEYKAAAGKAPAVVNPEQKQILRWCSAAESFAGGSLVDKDLEDRKLVVFFFNKVPSTSHAECYLLSELEATWAGEDPRTYQTDYNQRGDPINGQRVYKLPWANRLISQAIYDKIILKGERLFNLNIETPIKTKYGKSEVLTLYSGVSCPGLPF